MPSLFSAFFRAGQVIETFRGNGVYQPAVEEAISKLNDGRWVCFSVPILFLLIGAQQLATYSITGSHVPRGQSQSTVSEPRGWVIPLQMGNVSPHFRSLSQLPVVQTPTIMFRGRILMDAETLPTIIPIWLSHFDKIMPESRSFPRFIPRLLGPRQQPQPVRPTITFGEPFTFSKGTLERLNEYRLKRPSLSSRIPLGTSGGVAVGTEGTLRLIRDAVPSGMIAHHLDAAGVLKLRSDLTSELQYALGALGESAQMTEAQKQQS